jgi:hypothetical protein
VGGEGEEEEKEGEEFAKGEIWGKAERAYPRG